jgi:hypothetical protein
MTTVNITTVIISSVDATTFTKVNIFNLIYSRKIWPPDG